MDDVQFEEKQYTSRKIMGEPTVPGMSRFFLKTGIIKNEKQSRYILIGIVVICIIAAVYINIRTYVNFSPTSLQVDHDGKIILDSRKPPADLNTPQNISDNVSSNQ